MHVDVWSDIACPFCYLGKVTLEQSLAEFKHGDEVEVTYHSFLLNPAAPVDPDVDLYEYLADKMGVSRTQAIQMNDQMSARAAEEGLEWHMDKTIPSNTTDAHRLLHYALERDKQSEMKTRLFKAYFTEGRNIAHHDVLVELAGEVGLDTSEVAHVLETGKFGTEVEQDLASARSMGISGVPFFVINNKYAISGAQPKSLFVDSLQKAWDEEHPLVMMNQSDSADGCTDDSCST